MTSLHARRFITGIAILFFGVAGVLLLWTAYRTFVVAGFEEDDGGGLIAMIVGAIGLWSFVGLASTIIAEQSWSLSTRAKKIAKFAAIVLVFIAPVATASYVVIDNYRYSRAAKIRLCERYPQECKKR